MLIIFCNEPFKATQVDSSYEEEAKAAAEAGLAFALIDFGALVNYRDVAKATRNVQRFDPPRDAVYRGWMMTVDQYAAVYGALESRGVRLINTPDAYRFCHQGFAVQRIPQRNSERLQGREDRG
jgi:hypothetical protein